MPEVPSNTCNERLLTTSHIKGRETVNRDSHLYNSPVSYFREKSSQLLPYNIQYLPKGNKKAQREDLPLASKT